MRKSSILTIIAGIVLVLLIFAVTSKNVISQTLTDVAMYYYNLDSGIWQQVTGMSFGVFTEPATISTNYDHITTNTSTLLFYGQRDIIHRIVVNNQGSSSSISIYDDDTIPCNTDFVVTLPTTSKYNTELNMSLVIGACVVTAGTSPANITVFRR